MTPALQETCIVHQKRSGADSGHHLARLSEATDQRHHPLLLSERGHCRTTRQKKGVKRRGVHPGKKRIGPDPDPHFSHYLPPCTWSGHHDLRTGPSQDVNRSDQLDLLHSVSQDTKHLRRHGITLSP